jgi:predicted nuclease with TOPRIM domain
MLSESEISALQLRRQQIRRTADHLRPLVEYPQFLEQRITEETAKHADLTERLRILDASYARDRDALQRLIGEAFATAEQLTEYTRDRKALRTLYCDAVDELKDIAAKLQVVKHADKLAELAELKKRVAELEKGLS